MVEVTNHKHKWAQMSSTFTHKWRQGVQVMAKQMYAIKMVMTQKICPIPVFMIKKPKFNKMPLMTKTIDHQCTSGRYLMNKNFHRIWKSGFENLFGLTKMAHANS
eukprot:CAMPEP_0204018844 /NCGR_PEP_ID=MMETSP0360-20130528/28358_1 /ASSEMBLY_ACC=CAM_ASM_000342 /TAXON_ID=268821 /ORGANISM="Scrippsiella Hangoei, Strain SHTV-5" /LENGTH=104 /DNA_ID=CAMNT_0050962023 /DNA_START=33 /DNA_END=344 /DNA_ORIENTATION=+